MKIFKIIKSIFNRILKKKDLAINPPSTKIDIKEPEHNNKNTKPKQSFDNYIKVNIPSKTKIKTEFDILTCKGDGTGFQKVKF